MGKGGCVNGELDTTLYGSPIPVIGLYIVAATLVCFFSMSFDLAHGFIRKKPFVPCKFFPMNSFTMMVLAVATKIPVDLTTSMPRVDDQLSKLTGTALLCTSLGFYMPSLGTMATSELYGNLAAMTLMVISMIANVCIQMGTGVIFSFIIEHIIIMVCILVLLLLMWSSAIAFRGQKEFWKPKCKGMLVKEKEYVKDLQGLRNLLVKLHVINYTGNPQTLICETSHHHAFGSLCTLSSAVVIQALVRSFSLKNKSSCGGVSDYEWSISIVIVAQFLAIAAGAFSIIYRWVSFVIHTDWEDVFDAHKNVYSPQLELEILKLKTLSFRFLSKNFSNVFLVAKDSIIDLLIHTQLLFYTCSSFFIGFPIYTLKKFLECIIPFDRIFHEHTDGHIEEMFTSTSEMKDFVLLSSLMYNGNIFDGWIREMDTKDMMRWTNVYMADRSTHLIQLISNYPATFRSQCSIFIRKLEATGEDFVRRDRETGFLGYLKDIKYEYRVSCISVLVLSGILVELMPSSRNKSRMRCIEALNESFEVIYYVDQKTDIPIIIDETRWTLAKDIWAQWENPTHWFHTKIISPAFKSCSLKKSEESELELHHTLRILHDSFQAIEESLGQYFSNSFKFSLYGESLVEKHLGLIATEFSVICKFIQDQNYESVRDIFDFLEECFANMLCFTLRSLPLAILKEIDGDDPIETGEERVRKALKFFCELELLGETIEWSWPANDDLSLVQAGPNQISSTIVVAHDSSSDDDDNDDDDVIREIV